MFQGASQIHLDAKGRLAIPTRHRESLSAPGEGVLVLTAHPDGCLLLYPAQAWQPIRSQIMNFPALNRAASLWKRLLVGFAEDVVLDGSGRILVSPELRGFAGMEKQVMFVGQGSHFEIWNLEAWGRQLDELRQGKDAVLPPGMENFSL